MRRSITRNLLFALAAVVCGCTNVFLQPDRIEHMNPDRVGLKWEKVGFASADGTPLTGLWFPAAKTPIKGTIVQFHGNGQNMTSHFLSVYWLALEGWNVLAFDYRGYGTSGGVKSLGGAVADGVAALSFARAKSPGIPLVVVGQSLGGAVSIASLDRDGGAGVAALVLDSTFASYRGVARERLTRSWITWPFQWLAWPLVTDRYAPINLPSRKPSIPTLVMHARLDPIVPYAQGRLLFESRPEPKEFWEVPGAGHTEALGIRGAEFRPRLIRYLDDILSGQPPTAR